MPKAPLTKTRTRTPHRRAPATQRKPLITWHEFEAAHRASETIRSEYLAAGRKRSIRLERAVLDELDRNATKYLFANNTGARIQFAQVVTEHLEAFVEAEDTVFSWITLTPNQFVLAEDAAASFDPKRLQAWTRQELRGLTFRHGRARALHQRRRHHGRGSAGGHVARSRNRVGLTGARLTAIRDGINDRYKALLPGVDVAKFEPVANDAVVGKALYMLKAPQSEFAFTRSAPRRLTSKPAKSRPPTTAGLSSGSAPFAPATGFGCVRSSPINHSTGLLFAGGDGAKVLKAIRDAALKPLRDYECSQLAGRAACEAGFRRSDCGLKRRLRRQCAGSTLMATRPA